ncbi:MAG: (2Fe-2S)-binding protein [Myxococcota bacterium]
MSIVINGTRHEVDVEPEAPLLWVIREELGMTGTKFGCGLAMCGACTVHVNGRAVRSCVTPVGSIGASEIRTIEGLGTPDAPHPIQQAWVDKQVPQCGYCQPGMQMSVAAFLQANPRPTDDDINKGITNLCRCGCYERIREAIHTAAEQIQSASGATGEDR